MKAYPFLIFLKGRYRRFKKNKLAVFSVFILSVIIIFSFVFPLVSITDPDISNASQGLLPPSIVHFMGTDDMGRDLLLRIIYGGRNSLIIGFLASLIALIIGVMVGGLAGYYGGQFDSVLMRITDLFFSFPTIFLILILNMLLRDSQQSFIRNGLFPVSLIIGVTAWMELARVLRGSFLTLKEMEYVLAARSLGASGIQIMKQHILPNCAGLIIVNFTLLFSAAILVESGLSFIGFGVQPPIPTWGNLLDRGQSHFFTAPWVGFFPGMMISITLLAINSIGDGLRDSYDPHED